MFNFLGHKLLNKKWLNACLLLGIVLLVAVASCNPMFKNGSLDMMLSAKFDTAVEDNQKYAGVIGRVGSCATESYPDSDSVIARIDEYEKRWNSYMGISSLETQRKLYVEGTYAYSNLRSRKYFDICYMQDLEEHIQVVFGENLSNGVAEKGTYPCIMPQQYLDEYNMVVGEILTFEKMEDASGNTLQFTIVGAFQESDYSDIFWYENISSLNKNISSLEKEIFVSKEDFDEIIRKYNSLTIYYNDYVMLDYAEIDHKNALDIKYYLEEFQNLDSHFVQNFKGILDEYKEDAKTINIIIWVLELPIIVLLLAFIYMVSSQILEMEDGEIAMLKSRGTSTRQVLGIYLGQSSILSAVAIVLGIPVGYLLCKLAASATSFLKFSFGDTYFYTLDSGMLFYSLAAAAIAVLFVTLPVVKYAKNSIVEQKSKNGKVNTKPFWEKVFLDIILVVVSIYLLYNYNKQKSDIALNILSGKRPDPLIFLNSSLFIFAVGLLTLRLIKYLIKLIYFIGRKKWSPAVYASFLQITRTVKKQGFISVFLVMTIAMGMFNSNMARTMNENNMQRLKYNSGTALRVQEYWPMGIRMGQDKVPHWYYEEPDFERFTRLEGDVCESATRVIYDDNMTIKINGDQLSGSVLMGIHTKEFGETAELQSGLSSEHWYNYLNALAVVSNGVIISSNLAKAYNLSVGDSITYTRYNPIKGMTSEEIAAPSATICAIVDAWPGFEQYVYEKNEAGETVEKERYLVVANYSYVVGAFGQTPYEVWFKCDKNQDYQDVLDRLTDAAIRVSDYNSVDENILEMQESPLVLITNGLFSLTFMIAIILCTIGFLIYWITSIKQRELLFGIYRAMGMSMKEINKMLINEQIFSSVLASLSGYGVGVLTTMLFVKLVAVVYLPETHNIPISIVVNMFDVVKLTMAVLLMFIICFIVIRTILKKMNITQALKLGED